MGHLCWHVIYFVGSVVERSAITVRRLEGVVLDHIVDKPALQAFLFSSTAWETAVSELVMPYNVEGCFSHDV